MQQRRLDDGSLLAEERDIWENTAVGPISSAVPTYFLKGLHPLLAVLVEVFGTHPDSTRPTTDFDLSGGAFTWNSFHASADAANRKAISNAPIFTGRVLPDTWNFDALAVDQIRLRFPISGDMSGYATGTRVRMRITVRPVHQMPESCWLPLARLVSLEGPPLPEISDDD